MFCFLVLFLLNYFKTTDTLSFHSISLSLCCWLVNLKILFIYSSTTTTTKCFSYIKHSTLSLDFKLPLSLSFIYVFEAMFSKLKDLLQRYTCIELYCCVYFVSNNKRIFSNNNFRFYLYAYIYYYNLTIIKSF